MLMLFLHVNVISMICHAITIAVYLCVKELRNTLGKCVVCCLLCRLTIELLFMFFDTRTAFNYLIYFIFDFFLAALWLWLSVMSFHLWQVFGSVAFDEHRHQFLVYNVFVWITAAILVTVNTIYNFFFNSTVWTLFSIFNFTMFILTVRNIWKVRRELKKFAQRREIPPTCLHFDTQTYQQLTGLIAVMGLNNSAAIFLTYVNFFKMDSDSSMLEDIGNWLFHCSGIIVFILLILKRSTLKLLKDSVLLFPPVGNYRRYLIHQTCEKYRQQYDLFTFSVGQGPQRRTVLCFRNQLLDPNGFEA
ncbi:probable G-protein coupled receptor Mth-like 12 [Drosophila eugracilis]|uniref:probable G-protein coupled receptor Mth-like 12 n=1 Tax=Drosophila eugracilis TaxID=29029 RepID=UPI001BDB35A3|nr:probable G-protein coupled receptor Mth-like 12 [Drosophila eugracilis]